MNFKRIFSSIFAVILIMSVVSLSSCGDKTNKTNKTNETTDTENTENTDGKNVEENGVSDENNNTVSQESGEVYQMTAAEFKEKVFNYEGATEWNYVGDLPCVIDFYADWCGPCKMVAPIMEELAKEYKGKVIFYKVDVDKEGELSSVFGIQSIPSVLFCPKDNSQPEMSTGAMSKANYIEAIERTLGVK